MKKKFALLISHDVESQSGLKKCRSLAELDMQFGFNASFNIVPRKYIVPSGIRTWLQDRGFEIGIHDYNHDGNLFKSSGIFNKRVKIVNQYLKQWNVSGFRSASRYHSYSFLAELNILYDSSTFDTDPFEPFTRKVSTIFPFWHSIKNSDKGFVEIPYTLPQDFTLFIIKKDNDCRIWKDKLNWIAQNGGMAMIIAHPDYMNFDQSSSFPGNYSFNIYEDFLKHVVTEYNNLYWNPLPRDLAMFIRNRHFGVYKNVNTTEMESVTS